MHLAFENVVRNSHILAITLRLNQIARVCQRFKVAVTGECIADLEVGIVPLGLVFLFLAIIHIFVAVSLVALLTATLQKVLHIE
jgi:hypothetical protein